MDASSNVVPPAARFVRIMPVLTVALVCSLSIGCAEDGPTRYHVSGSATYAGRPIPQGSIRFIPDSRANNRGPAGFAVIENGRYDTSRSGRGTVGGPHLVLISGFDGQASPGEETEGGRPLFPDHRAKTELPKETATRDFDVPRLAAN